MHFGRKRIVDLVIKQVAALFADGNERLYRFVFFFKKNLRHKSSRSQRAFLGPSGSPTDQIPVCSRKFRSHTRWAGRAVARFGTFFPAHSLILCEASSAPAPPYPLDSCVARIPHLPVRGP